MSATEGQGGDDPRERIRSIVAAAEPHAATAHDGDAPDDMPAEDMAADGGADGGSEGPPPDDPTVDWQLVRICAAEPETDIGNSRRFRHRHGEDVLHVQNIGWHGWDGKRWYEDVDHRLLRPMAHGTVEAITLEPYLIEPSPREQEAIDAAEEAGRALARMTPEELKGPRAAECKRAREHGEEAMKAVQARRQSRRRFAKSAGNKGRLDAMVSEAVAYLSRPIADLDADALALNLDNGTIRFVSEEDPDCPDPDIRRHVWRVEMRPHDRKDLNSKLAPATFDPGARAPTFEAFIARVLPDAEVRAFVQRYFGYGLTALTSEQCFVLFHGEGRNGKSTLVDAICQVMGDYTTSLPISTLVGNDQSRKGSEATPDLARIPGARIVRTAEPKEGLPFDESLIKGLTGGEPIPVRRLNREFIDVYPTFKLVISANRKPVIKGNDDGIWRRVLLVPFDVQIPEDEVDKRLPEKLEAERSGILNWMIAGALDYLARGRLEPPEVVRAATQEYRDESDYMGAFARAALEVTRNTRDAVTPGEMYEAFKAWCERQAITPLQPTTFNRRMPKTAQQFGFDKAKASTVIYQGVRILSDYLPGVPASSRTT